MDLLLDQEILGLAYLEVPNKPAIILAANQLDLDCRTLAFRTQVCEKEFPELQDQEDVVASIMKRRTSIILDVLSVSYGKNSDSSILWAIGKAEASLGMRTLISIGIKNTQEPDVESIDQFVLSFDSFVGEDTSLIKNQLTALTVSDKPVLSRWLNLGISSSRTDVRRAAFRLHELLV